jgi:hypothetical protein
MSILRLALNFASYAASSAVVREGAAFVSSAFRRGVAKYAKQGTEVKGIGKVLGGLDREVSQVKGQLQHIRNKLQQSVGPSNYKKLGRIGTQVEQEISFLPANYLYYRMEKHKAVTPEERAQTKNFARFYLGVPMMSSIAAGYALQNVKATQSIGRAVGHVIKRMNPATRKKMVEGAQRWVGTEHKGVQYITDRLVAMNRARQHASEKGILWMLRTYPRKEVMGRLTSSYRFALGNVMHGTSLLAKQTEKATKEFAGPLGILEGRIRSSSGSQRKHAIEAHSQIVRQKISMFTGMRERMGYRKADGTLGGTPSPFMQFMDHIVDSSGDEQLRVNRTLGTVEIGGYSIKKGKAIVTKEKHHIPEGYGRYTVGKHDFKLGTLAPSFMRDELIDTFANSKLYRFGAGLFGLTDHIKMKKTEEALLGSFIPMTERKMLTMPHNIFNINDQNETYETALRRLTGSTFSDNDYRFDDFVKTRLDLMGDNASLQSKRELLTLSLLKGSIPLGKGDTLIHTPMGNVGLLTGLRQTKRGVKVPTFVRLGHLGDGQYMNYLKLSSDTNSLPIRMIRNLHGSVTTGYIQESRVSGRLMQREETITLGPGLAEDKVSVMEAQGISHWIRSKLDLAGGGIISKIGSIFGKHTSPEYGPTLMGWMKDDVKREALVSSGRSLGDLAKTLHRESSDASLDLYQSLVQHLGGTDAATSFISKLGSVIDIPELGGISLNEVLISPTDYATRGSKSALKKIDAVLRYIRGSREDMKLGAGQSTISGISFLDEDVSFFSRIKSAMSGESESSTKTAGELLGGAGKKITAENEFISTVTRLDEYNAGVLRLMMGVRHRQGDFAAFKNALGSVDESFSEASSLYAMSDKERSAFYAMSHLSALHHDVAAAYASHLPTGAEQGIRGRVSSIISTMTGNRSFDDVIKYYETRFRYRPYTPWLDDSAAGAASEIPHIFALPGKLPPGTAKGVSVNTYTLNQSQIRVAEGVMDMGTMTGLTMLHAFNRTANEILGIGFREENMPTIGSYVKGIATKRVLPFMALSMGYSIADRLADRYLEDTPFSEGFTVFGMNVLAGARLAAQNMLDLTRVTDVSKYLEGLMPGIVSSPLSGLARGFGPAMAGFSIGHAKAGPVGALTGGIIGSAVSMLVGGGPLGMFGEWDISKSRRELLDEYTGRTEVAVRKGRWWELGGTPFEGTKIQYFRPHLYHLTRSRYKQTPGFKDSMLTEMVGALAPDLYAAKGYYSRPYPVTAGLGTNIPIASSVLGTLPGFPLGAGIPMHQAEMSTGYALRQLSEVGIQSAELSSFYTDFANEQAFDQGGARNFESSTLVSERPMAKQNFEWNIGEAVNNIKDIIGMRGFVMGSLYEQMSGRTDLFDYAPSLASPAEIPGFQRSYWDLELGGLLGASEVLRRYLPHKRNQIDMVNPIRNTLPTWLPGRDYLIDFQHGDPYTAVPLGEARLPGPGYETSHRVDLAFPIEASVLGEDVPSQVAYYLGFPDYMNYRNVAREQSSIVADMVRANAERYGSLVKKGATLYNPQLDLRASVDAVIRMGNGQVPVSVVPRDSAGESELNAFLVMSNVDAGLLVNVDPRTGAYASRMIRRDLLRFNKDVERARLAAAQASAMLPELEEEGKAMNLANAYSWFDRYRILADVAPYSAEFKEADAIVRQQMQSGSIDQGVRRIYDTVQEQIEKRRNPFDFKEYRFLHMGDPLTDYGKERKAFYEQEYNSLERGVGAVWEFASHLRNPVSAKLLHHRSALEEYENTAVYGKRIKMWQSPVSDFLGTYLYQGLGTEDPFQNAMSWGLGGLVLGGTPFGKAFSLAGAAVSAVGSVQDEAFIPGRTEYARDVVAQMDTLKYAKYRKLYSETGDLRFATQAARTATGYAVQGKAIPMEILAQTSGYPERDFIENIINNVTTSNVDRVAKLLPTPAVASMYQHIGDASRAKVLMSAYGEQVESRMIPGGDSSVYSQDVPEYMPAITTMNQEGANAHDAGLGWYRQLAAMERSKRLGLYQENDTLFPGSFQSRLTVQNFVTSIDEQGRLRQVLGKYSSNLSMMDDGQDRIELEIVVRK